MLLQKIKGLGVAGRMIPSLAISDNTVRNVKSRHTTVAYDDLLLVRGAGLP